MLKSDVHCAIVLGHMGNEAEVLDALEWSVHAMPAEFGGFEHVAGLTFTVDPDAVYKLVTNDYILMDGDGFTMFRESEVLEDAEETDSEVLLEYISSLENGMIGEEYADPYGQGRITVE